MTTPSSAGPEGRHGNDDWSSPLWGRPDTVVSEWPQAPMAAPAPQLPPTPPPHRPTRKALIAAGAGVAAAVLAVTAVVSGVLPDHKSRIDASRTPISTAPVVPTPTPSQTAPDPAPSAPDPDQSNGAGDGTNGGQGAAPSQGTDPNQGTTPGQGTAPQGGTQDPNLTQRQKAAAAAVTPGLVDVVSTIGYDGGQGAGTGIILSADGLILTNHHVIAGSTSLAVTVIATGKVYRAKVLGYDATHDIAVIKLVNASGLTPAPLGDSTKVAIGDEVIGVGNAGGRGGAPSVVAGSVTGLDKSITAQDAADGTSERLSGLIETDANIEAGDSGGALVSADGKVIGVITAGSVSGHGQTTATDGYAVPMATAHDIARQIIAGRSSSTVHIGGTAFLGVSIDGSGLGALSGPGVPVAEVTDGTAAARAGITAGSSITAIGGQTIRTPDSLHAALAKKRPGDRVSVSWIDPSGAKHTVTVTLGEGPVG